MIVRMKKVYAITQQKDVESIVNQLGVLGVVHLEPQQPLVSEDIALAKENVQLLEQSLSILAAEAGNFKKEGSAQKLLDENWQDVLGEILRAYEEKIKLQSQISKRESEINIWKPWGNFDPQDVKFLSRNGLVVQLWQGHRKDLERLTDDAVVQVINENGKAVFFVTIAPRALNLSSVSIALPSMSLEKMQLLQTQDQNALERYSEDLLAKGCFLRALENILTEQKAVLNFKEASQGRGESQGIVYLKGYCPINDCLVLEQEAKKNKWVLLVQEPADDDLVPTLVRNPKWIEIISPMFTIMNIVPGYREKDISPFFLVFFAIFFSMLVGDAGYGMIFLLITTFAHRFYGAKMPEKSILYLSYFLSAATIIWGILTGTFFGTLLFGGMVKPLIPWLTDTKNVQLLCFTLGVIHLTLAHIWRALTRGAVIGAFAEFGWILMLWGSYFLANMMLIGISLPAFVSYLYIVGGILVLVDIIAQRKDIGVNMILFVFSVINTFGDIVSYIRLFAVGLAGVAVADAFNQMALTIGFSNPISGVIAVFILAFVHLFLNLALSVMGVLVHGIRLNVLEFSGHLGMEWSGINYRPYKIMMTAIKN